MGVQAKAGSLSEFLDGRTLDLIANSQSHRNLLVERGVLTAMDASRARFLPIDHAVIEKALDGAERVANLWLDMPGQVADQILISPYTVLFDTGYCRNLVTTLYNALPTRGRLLVPEGNATRQELSQDRLEACLGVRAERRSIEGVKCYLEFNRRISAEVPNSTILDWAWTGVPNIILNKEWQRHLYDYMISSLICPQDDVLVFKEFVTHYRPHNHLNTSRGGDARLAKWVEPAAVHQTSIPLAQLCAAASGQSYSIGGLRYKGAVLSAILRAHFGARRNLQLTDLGGGYGALAAELLLSEASPLTSVCVNDPSLQYLIYAHDLYLGLRHRLRGKFAFALDRMEDFSPPSSDVITMIGSFLFVAPEERRGLVRRLFKNLRPGGLLIVHENMKTPGYARAKEYDLMFDAAELDDILGELGSVKHYAATYIGELTAEQAQTGSVFRTVGKPVQ